MFFSEAEREANIARNKALLAQLDISLDIPKKVEQKEKAKANEATITFKQVFQDWDEETYNYTGTLYLDQGVIKGTWEDADDDNL